MARSRPKCDPIIVIADLGNWGLKVLVVRDDGTSNKYLIPHDVLFLTEVQYRAAKERAQYQKNRIQNSVTFRKFYQDGDELYAIVGQEAVENRNSNKLYGSNKYVTGYFDVVLAGVLLHILPEGHDNIILGVGYPPSELPQVPRLTETLIGTHKVQGVDGAERKYTIRLLIPVDEPIGSLEWYAHNNAKYNPVNINRGDRFILIDIGGSIGTIGRVLLNDDGTFTPMYDSFLGINNGVNVVHKQLAEHLRSMYPYKFPDSIVPPHILRDALSYRELTLSDGETFSVEEAVIQSLGIVDDVEAKYLNDFQGGRFDKGVLLTGGAMMDLYPEFETVIRHTNVAPVSDVKEIIYANVRGIMLIVLAALMQDGKLPRNYEGAYDGYLTT